jgi:hypothetical protein
MIAMKKATAALTFSGFRLTMSLDAKTAMVWRELSGRRLSDREPQARRQILLAIASL